VEPFVEEVEDREQLLLGGRAASPRLGFHPVAGPALLALLEEGEHEFVLRGEVPVKGRFGDACAFDQFVDADVVDAAVREELVGGVEDALAGGRCGR
jgi:hypothetical protein